MPGFLRVMTLEGALSELGKHWRPKPKVARMSLDGACGLVLAEDVASKLDLPPFDRAAVDGYAVRAADTFGASEDKPVKLLSLGSVRAGDWPRLRLRQKRCIEIATGAPMPEGADAVAMVEHSVARGDVVSIYRAVAPGENVAKLGSEIKRGSIVLRAGHELSPSSIGTLAAIGIKKVKVYRRPRVVVISSGAELQTPGSKLRRGHIYDVNGPTICNAIRACGGEAEYLGIAEDKPSQIARLVKKGLLSCDIVIISGGSSAGAGDIIPTVVDELGRPGLIVHGLAMKPGKPTFLALARGKPIFGLPGYPVSALMVFDKLVVPYIRQLAHLSPLRRAATSVKLSKKILSARGRQEFVPVKLLRRQGELWAEPILKGSGAITALSMADGYIEVPLKQEIVEAGTIVEVRLFGA